MKGLVLYTLIILQVESVIKDALGKALNDFFGAHRELICRVDEIYKEKARADNTILWKKLRDQGKCDTHSILEKDVSSCRALAQLFYVL